MVRRLKKSGFKRALVVVDVVDDTVVFTLPQKDQSVTVKGSKTLNFSDAELIAHERGMTIFSRKQDDVFSKLFLFILRLAVYSKSTFLTMTALSLFGLIHGVACVPRKRASAVKSLLRYGVAVLQHALGASAHSSL